MNTDNWNPLFKKNYYTKKVVETNLVYTPLINPDNTVFCMNFDHTHPYQNEMVSSFLPNRPYYTKKTVKYFFDREVTYIDCFKNYTWSPNYLEIDKKNQKIFFEWPGETCNRIVTDDNDLNIYCPNWESQLLNIIKDILKNDSYKITLYPHCFFIENNVLKTFDFYGCVDKNNPVLPLEEIIGILGVASSDRLEFAIKDDTINAEILFKQALTGYACWPTNVLEKLAFEIF